VAAATAPAVAETAAPASPFKFGAFFDLRFTRLSVHNNATVPNANAESGFGLEDAAFYANYDRDRVSAVLDIAFRRSKDSDINSSATVPNQSSNGNFAIGFDKSQAYLKYRVTPAFIVNFGQFDTIYGVELNDSKDRVFGKTGLVYDLTLPVTHAGAMLEYSTSGAYAKAFAANPNNKGSYGSSTAGDDKTELGVALGYSNEYIRSQVGYMSRPIRKANASGMGSRSLLDATLGTTLGAFTLDLEFSQVSDANKNTLSSTNNNDQEKSGVGYLALATYRVLEPLLLGVRYEEIRHDPSNASLESGKAKGVSVHYRLAPELELRSEFVDYRFVNVSKASWNDSRFNFAAVFTF